MYSEGTKVGEKSKNNFVETPSLLKHNRCNPEAITLCSETAYMSQAHCVEKPLRVSLRQDAWMASFYKIALPSLPSAMKKENHAMSSFVLIDVFWFKFWSSCSFRPASVLHAGSLSLRASEQSSFLLLSNRRRDGDNNLN